MEGILAHDFSLKPLEPIQAAYEEKQYLDIFTLICKFEKCMFLGCLINLNSLLYTVTIMPL
jgi:hypothetical protein